MGKRKTHPQHRYYHGYSEVVHHRSKRRRTQHLSMSNAAMKGEGDGGHQDRHDGQQEESFMIPGVDGRLQFGFPQKIITILRYATTQIQVSTSGGNSTYIYRMNGAFDPDLTGIGHQPMFWDNFSAVYQNYRVLGSRITIEWAPALYNDDSTGPWHVGIVGNPSSSSLGSDFESRAEQNQSISDVLTSRDGTRTLSMTYSPMTSLGRPPGDDTVGALVTTIPTQQYFAHVWMRDIKGPASSTVYHKAMIEYTVEFFAPQIQSTS